jgi:uncharacterized protein with PQ loop repeat
MKFLRNPQLVSYTPLVTTLIFEAANVGQLIEMWSKKTALGQSLFSWSIVTFALLLWLNFYTVKTPDEKWAIWATIVGILMNLVIVATVAYFKYLRFLVVHF